MMVILTKIVLMRVRGRGQVRKMAEVELTGVGVRLNDYRVESKETVSCDSQFLI